MSKSMSNSKLIQVIVFLYQVAYNNGSIKVTMSEIATGKKND